MYKLANKKTGEELLPRFINHFSRGKDLMSLTFNDVLIKYKYKIYIYILIAISKTL